MQINNCWNYAIKSLILKQGWLIAKFTKRSSTNPSKYFGWFGSFLIGIGLLLFNYGMWIRTGKWLHAHHASNISGPYSSYEPIEGKLRKLPPLWFKGKVVVKDSLINDNLRGE